MDWDSSGSVEMSAPAHRFRGLSRRWYRYLIHHTQEFQTSPPKTGSVWFQFSEIESVFELISGDTVTS